MFRKGIKLYVLLSVLIPLSQSCYRADIPKACELGREYVTNIPYQTGIIYGDSSEIATGIFLDDRTVLTTAHCAMFTSGEKIVVVAADESFLLTHFKNPNGKLDLDFSTKFFKKDSFSECKPHLLCSFNKTDHTT